MRFGRTACVSLKRLLRPDALASHDSADQEWAEHISADLITRILPSVNGRLSAAAACQLSLDLVLLALSWALKIYIHPSPIPTTSLQDRERFWELLFARAQVGLAPGWLVILVGAVFNSLIFIVAFGRLN